MPGFLNSLTESLKARSDKRKENKQNVLSDQEEVVSTQNVDNLHFEIPNRDNPLVENEKDDESLVVASDGSGNQDEPNDDGDSDNEEDQDQSVEGAMAPPQERASENRLSSTEPKAAKPSPKISTLVNSAILQLKEPRGSTIEMILHYLKRKHNIDPDQKRQSVRSYLKRALEKGSVIHTRGEGAQAKYQLAPEIRAQLKKSDRVSCGRSKGSSSSSSKRQKPSSAVVGAASKKKTSPTSRRVAPNPKIPMKSRR